MTPNKFDYPTAFRTWGDEEYAAIERVVRSGNFTAGEEVDAFEAEFAEYHGRKHAIMVNNGSDANLLMVAALCNKTENPLRPGDKAVVPALAWPTTYGPAVQHDLDLTVLDCDGTWGAAGSFSQEEHRLIIGCPVLGNPHHIPEFKHAYFIEDCCESLGARHEFGRRVGTHGVMASFSFYFSHQLSAIEGGMILTDDDEMNDLCRMLRDHGLSRTVKPAKCFTDEYNVALFGYNVRSTEIHAAVGREQLKKLEGFKKARWANYLFFRHEAEGLPLDHPRWVGEPSVFGLHFCVKDSETRDRLAMALRAQSIDCRPPVGGSFTRHPYGKPWRHQATPNADRIHDTGMFLGNSPMDLTKEIALAVDVMRGVL